MFDGADTFEYVLKDLDKALRRELYADLKMAGAAAKQALRAEFSRHFRGGGRLSGLVGSVYYGDGDDPLEITAGVYIRGRKWPAILGALAEGATIQGRGGNFLAVPTAAVPQMRGGRGNKAKMTPAQLEAYYNKRLIYVPPRGGRPGLLLMDFGSGGGRRNGQAVKPVVMYIIVKTVTLPRRFDMAEVVGRVWNGL